eukprot:NODE_723_length_4443_cov_1.043048.p3 type:complete len:142 gc:universal NODE_723_length_4443_cov_1.043048:2568-2143(-)
MLMMLMGIVIAKSFRIQLTRTAKLIYLESDDDEIDVHFKLWSCKSYSTTEDGWIESDYCLVDFGPSWETIFSTSKVFQFIEQNFSNGFVVRYRDTDAEMTVSMNGVLDYEDFIYNLNAINSKQRKRNGDSWESRKHRIDAI